MIEPVKNTDLEKRIFAASRYDFSALALEIFHFQYAHNAVYRKYCSAMQVDPEQVISIEKIPFLPISLFKTHDIVSTEFEPEAIFESSGTTAQIPSRHLVKDLNLYRKSFTNCFEHFYGPAAQKCILALLPAYLERKNSSLVLMADALIQQSKQPQSGFYLYDHEKLHRSILHNELLKIPTLLIGVTYALLDFAEQFPMQLRHTIVMETGGMKGRREEMTRQEVHQILQQQLGLSLIHSEYGMTELLSQAYSKGDGIFHTAPWMQVLIRALDDPLYMTAADKLPGDHINGAINIIDLANLYSCSFIATDDMGKLNKNGSFEVLGRADNSDVRGCSLMVL